MPHNDHYESPRLDRTLDCVSVVVELDSRLSALGPGGGPHVPELQTTCAVPRHPGRRRLCDTQLADLTAPPITPTQIMELASMEPMLVPVQQLLSQQFRTTAGQFRDSASIGCSAATERAGQWSNRIGGGSAARAQKAAEWFGSAIVAVSTVSIAIPAIVWFIKNAEDRVENALHGDLGAVFSLWRTTTGDSARYSALVPTTFLAIAVLTLVYCIGSEVIFGGSVGKRILGYKVVTPEGRRPSLLSATKRNWWPAFLFLPTIGLFCWIAAIIILAVSILTNSAGRSILDRWAGVAVIDGFAKRQAPTNRDGWTNQ